MKYILSAPTLLIVAMFIIPVTSTPHTAEAETLATILEPYSRDDNDESEEEEDNEEEDDDDRRVRYYERQYRDFSRTARRLIEELHDEDPLKSIPVPVLGVSHLKVTDSWGDPRSGGRTHEGTDIFAPRGTFILSPSAAVVTSTGYGSNGGNFVYTINPGGERFYFAHLDSIDPRIERGVVLEKGDIIGKVGNTGNAIGASPHLHFGIYRNGAQNPYPRLTSSFSLTEILDSLVRHLAYLKDARA